MGIEIHHREAATNPAWWHHGPKPDGREKQKELLLQLLDARGIRITSKAMTAAARMRADKGNLYLRRWPRWPKALRRQWPTTMITADLLSHEYPHALQQQQLRWPRFRTRYIQPAWQWAFETNAEIHRLLWLKERIRKQPESRQRRFLEAMCRRWTRTILAHPYTVRANPTVAADVRRITVPLMMGVLMP